MSSHNCLNRRDFLKGSAAGAAGLAVAGPGVKNAFAQSGPWTDGMQINPDIDNLRVAYVQDDLMLTDTNYGNFAMAQDHIDASQVSDNMDTMASALSQESDSSAAWDTIFRKPDSKEWSAVVVAMKVNGIGSLHPSVAVVNKLCQALISKGVQAGNITVYDACHGATGHYNNYKGNGLPSGINISDGGATYSVTVGSGTLSCTAVVQNADILINCAVNKGHNQSALSGVTMALKNHTGTMKFSCPGSMTQMCDENKSEGILGSPSAGVPVKQQLCVVDSLYYGADWDWAGGVDRAPSAITMGTFGGAVDYLTAEKIRREWNGADYEYDIAKSFLTQFGYDSSICDTIKTMDASTDELGRGWVDALAWTPTGVRNSRGREISMESVLDLSVSGAGIKGSAGRVKLNRTANIKDISVYDSRGKMIKTLMKNESASRVDKISWDGKDRNGNTVSAGKYFIKVNTGRYVRSAGVTLMR